MKRIHPATALVAAGVLLAGCGGQATSNPARSDAPSSTAAASVAGAGESPTSGWAGPVIPDGTYARTRTRSDAKSLGIPREKADEIFGDDGELELELRLAGDAWAQFGDDGGSMSLGDDGTATYDAEGHWLITSAGSGCPGCTATFDWSLEGDRLTLTLLDTTEAGDPVNVLVGRLVMEGTWVRR